MDNPFRVVHLSDDKGRSSKKFVRDLKFDLMLAAIEENSGHMIILSNIKWGIKVDFQIENSRLMHSRVRPKEFEYTCRFNQSL